MCRDHRGLALKLLSTSSAPRPRGVRIGKAKTRPLSFLTKEERTNYLRDLNTSRYRRGCRTLTEPVESVAQIFRRTPSPTKSMNCSTSSRRLRFHVNVK